MIQKDVVTVHGESTNHLTIMQGEIQRLRDKITIAEKSAKIEAQLNVSNTN
jgi:hypothetical protein